MTSSFQTTPGALRITLSGDLIGGADAIQFSTDLRDRISNNPLLFKEGAAGGSDRAGGIELDATKVGFVNSSGLGMLIAARQTALDHGAGFRLIGAGEQLRHLLEITKLTEILGAA